MAKYTIKKEYTANYFNNSTHKMETKTFKVGDTVNATYYNGKSPNGQQSIELPKYRTTMKNTEPNEGISGEVVIEIPADNISESKLPNITPTKIALSIVLIGVIAYIISKYND